MGAVEPSFEDIPNIFDTGGSKGLPGDSVEKIPKIKIRSSNNVDSSREEASCSVCLQDFQVGETVRSLPHCHHMFHLPCIDKWLGPHSDFTGPTLGCTACVAIVRNNQLVVANVDDSHCVISRKGQDEEVFAREVPKED